jgi:saccharopine dehydrogenase-like NADP-dependent oxidoreductase
VSRILVVGAGGVGASMASIAESRTFFEVFVLADINEQRCVDALKNLDNADRFLTAKVDANSKADLVALAKAHKIDIIVNA